MLMILLNWLYMGITTFVTGYAVLGLFAHLFEYKIRRATSYLWAGMAFVTVYAQIWSLFSGVSVLASLILCFLCIVIIYLYKGQLEEEWKRAFGGLQKQKWKGMFLFFLLLLFAYGTSRGYMHFDTGLYHAQSIRWIEEYGVVPGLAALQARFGYNSSAFALTALYSMKGILGQSLHATAGFFALLGAFEVLNLYKVFSEKRVRLSDFARIGLVFYLSVIFSEMMSPASDYYAQVLLFVVLILWLEEDEWQKEKQIQNPTPYGLLCILLVYAATIKFSVAPLLLLVLKPAVMLLKKKDVKQIFVCLAAGLITVVPFFIRNVMISGWLVYPFAGIDLFSVDWKIPKGQVQYDAMEIGVYGKGITDVTKWDTPFMQWCPSWFAGLKILEKLFVLATVAAITFGLVYAVGVLIKSCMIYQKRMIRWKKMTVSETVTPLFEEHGNIEEKSLSFSMDFLLVFVVFTIGTAFWFFSAPLVRYGYAYVLALPLITFGFFYVRIVHSKGFKKIRRYCDFGFYVILIAFLLTRVKGVAQDIVRTYKEPYYITQMDYIDGSAETQVIDGITFYVPTENGQIGYNKFPSSLFVQPIELRGDSIEDGFRLK